MIKFNKNAEYVKTDIFINDMELIKPEENDRCFRYLESNLIENKENFYYNEKTKNVFYLNSYNNNLLSYKTISLVNQKKRELIPLRKINNVYNISDLDVDMDYYSLVYNIFNVSQNSIIYIFDDFFNSLQIKNSIYIQNLVQYIDLFKLLNVRFIFSNNKYGKDMRSKVKKLGYLSLDWNILLADNKIKNVIYDILNLKKVLNTETIDINNYLN